MPQMGYDMQEGTVVRWLKEVGSEVSEGEPIAEIETDKAVVEFESYASGVLHSILVPEGTTVPVGQPIAVVGSADEAPGELPTMAEPSAVEVSSPPAQVPPVVATERPDAAAPSPPGEVRASPVARRLAGERRIDLAHVVGTGPGGRITRDDVLDFEGAVTAPAPEATAALVPTPAPPSAPRAEPGAGERIPLSKMRKQIARVTTQSKREKPHFYVSAEVDMTRAMDLREQLNHALEPEGIRVTVNDLIIKACVEALKKHPSFNAFLQEDTILRNDKINIGMAIAGGDGLILPAILDCGDRSLKDIAVASKDLAERAKSGTLHPQEYRDGTFAVSNLGMFDVTSFMAIIQPPQTAVLAVGAVAKKPVVRGDEITVAQMMTATLAADHRVVDGAEAARFLIEVKRLLENPLGLVVYAEGE